MSVNEMTQHSTYINNNKLKSPFPFSLWFKPIFSNLLPTSSLGEHFANATFNYLTPECMPFTLPSYFCAQLSCHRRPFIYSPQPHIEFLFIFQGSDQISLLFVAFSDHSHQKSLSPNVQVFNNHCLHVALNHVLSYILFLLCILIVFFPDFKLIVERSL